MRTTELHPLLVGAAAVLLLAPALANAASQLPTDAAEALRQYETEVDLSKWADGPVSYLMLDDESDTWKTLETDDQRRRFIKWFWDRRDDDLRTGVNPLEVDYYTRVAMANHRFSGFPRGWRSDRGRVWSVLGRPDNIKTDMATELVVWTYFTHGGILSTVSAQGELKIYFAQTNTATWTIYGGVGPGAWPAYVLRAIDIVDEALIQNPDLEFHK